MDMNMETRISGKQLIGALIDGSGDVGGKSPFPFLVVGFRAPGGRCIIDCQDCRGELDVIGPYDETYPYHPCISPSGKCHHWKVIHYAHAHADADG